MSSIDVIQAFQTIPSSIHHYQHQPLSHYNTFTCSSSSLLSISHSIRLSNKQKIGNWRRYTTSSLSSLKVIDEEAEAEAEEKTMKEMDVSKKSIHFFAKTIENENNDDIDENVTTITDNIHSMKTEKKYIDDILSKSDISEKDNNLLLLENQLPFSNEISTFFISPQVEILDLLLILLSSFFVAIGTLPASKLPSGFDQVIIFGSDALTYMFGLAFFLRWYGVGQLSMKYLTKPLAILDIFVSVIPLATILPTFGFINMPTWLLSNSGLVNLRLLRILRLSRVLQDLETFGKFEVALGLKPGAVKSYQLELARVLLSIFTLLSVASGLIYSAEHQVNPDMTDYFTALYFGLTTLTTVGFGDITPVTFNGRLVVMGSILFGVAVIPAQAARLFEALIEFQEERRMQLQLQSQSKEDDEITDIKQILSNNKNNNGDIEGDMAMQTFLKQRYDQGALLDSRISCQNCGVRCHRIDAIYCFSCGEKL